MKQVALIIFDLDGTLVDSKEGIVKAINYTFHIYEKEPMPIL